MKKYVLMLLGVVGVSMLGGVGVVYSLLTSAPMTVTRQNSIPQTMVAGGGDDEDTAIAVTIR